MNPKIRLIIFLSIIISIFLLVIFSIYSFNEDIKNKKINSELNNIPPKWTRSTEPSTQAFFDFISLNPKITECNTDPGVCDRLDKLLELGLRNQLRTQQEVFYGWADKKYIEDYDIHCYFWLDENNQENFLECVRP